MTLNFTLDYSVIPMTRIANAIRRANRGWRTWAMLAALMLAFIGTGAMLGRLGYDVLPGFALCYAAFLVWAVYSNLRRPFERAQKAAPTRLLPISVTLSSEGVHTENALVRTDHAWPAIAACKRIKGYVILMPSAVEYIPIPLDQLPDGWDADRLVTQIEDWRHQ